jgi:hypothetical protein
MEMCNEIFSFALAACVSRWPSSLASSCSTSRSARSTRASARYRGRPRSGAKALAARFVHGSAIGPVARLEFALEPSAQTINAELPRERFRELSLRPAEMAYLTPTRLHQFAPPA